MPSRYSDLMPLFWISNVALASFGDIARGIAYTVYFMSLPKLVHDKVVPSRLIFTILPGSSRLFHVISGGSD